MFSSTVMAQSVCPTFSPDLANWKFNGGTFAACGNASLACNTCIGMNPSSISSDPVNYPIECCHGIECISNAGIYGMGSGQVVNQVFVFQDLADGSKTNSNYSKDKLFKYVTDKAAVDPYHPCVNQIKSGSNASVMLGSPAQNLTPFRASDARTSNLSNLAQVYYDFIVDENNKYYNYSFALVLGDEDGSDPKGHPYGAKAFFEARAYDYGLPRDVPQISPPVYYDKTNASSHLIPCSQTTYYPHANIDGFTKTGCSIANLPDVTDYVKDWSTNLIDLSAYVGHKVRIVFTVSGCSASGHYGYAYLDASCFNAAITPNTSCLGEPTPLKYAATGLYTIENYAWDFGDGSPISNEASPVHSYQTAGVKTISFNLTTSKGGTCGTISYTKTIDVQPCLPPYECAECVPSFSPLPNQEYLLSAWVKEDYTNKYPDTYLHSGIQITFKTASKDSILPLMRPVGPIIDGWQRIEASFTVPVNAKNIQIELVNDGAAGDVFFDDIRIHPFRSNMKSFVYNPSTQKLTAELDENNYSTQYEYDDEGILIRVKKETERGVMTIKETRNNQSKVQGTH